MLKNYILESRIDEKLSETAGTVTFRITDENDVTRDITAETFLDENQVPQGVTASNKRELPLVEGLFRMEIGEETSIDFTLYNNGFSREVDKTTNQIAYDEVIKMQNEKSLAGRLKKIFKSFHKKKEEVATS